MPSSSVLRPRRVASMLLACLLAAGCGGQPEPPRAGPAIDQGGRMEALYSALAALEDGRAKAPVTLLQIGDSHTETDAFSGRLRELFQARFGDAGRGPLQPGLPTRWYRPRRVAVEASPGWRMEGTRPGPAAGIFGMAGIRATATVPDATMSLTTEAGFDRATVELLRQPDGGTLEVTADAGPPHVIATAADAEAPSWRDIPVPHGSRTLALRARGDGPVTLLMWGTGRDAPGIILANLGIVGARAGLIDRWDAGALAAEAAALKPALVLVAFGTNEGFDPALDLPAYRDGFAARLARLRAAMPQAAILVIGPPDGNRAPRLPRRGRRPRIAGCVSDAAPGRPVWSVPPTLGEVRAAQRDVAERNGWMFWDWSEAMGGPCSMDRWVHADPPLAWPDHVHLKEAGYEATAQALFAAIMRGYAAFRARPPA